MTGKKFLFVGNRRFVLEEMLALGLDVSVVAVIGETHLHRDVAAGFCKEAGAVEIVRSKAELINLIRRETFDVLVSNGCPYILPVGELPDAVYVNIHPSCLPDLRGIDPVIGAVLFGRDSGATCHIMDSGVDTGPIISQIRIPFSDDLDATLLYQLSFRAEQMAFRAAYKENFIATIEQKVGSNDLYYSRRPEDRLIDFSESNTLLVQKIKAFSNRSQGCEFVLGDIRYKVYGVRILSNQFLTDVLSGLGDGIVAFSVENSIIFKKDGAILQFRDVYNPDGTSPRVGDKLFESPSRKPESDPSDPLNDRIPHSL